MFSQPLTIKSFEVSFFRQALRDTTNAVKTLHSQFRKLTKAKGKGAFPNESSLLKLLYVGITKASQKWTMPIANWGQTLSQLTIYFEGRLDGVMKL